MAPPDALVIRSMRDGWTVMARIPEHRLGIYLQGGWTVLLTESQVRTVDIQDTRQAEEDRWKRE